MGPSSRHQGGSDPGECLPVAHDEPARNETVGDEPPVRVVDLSDPVTSVAARIASEYADLLARVVGHTNRAANRMPSDGAARAELGAARRAAEEAQDLSREIMAVGRTARLAPEVLDVSAVVERLGAALVEALPPGVSLVIDQSHRACFALLDRSIFEASLLRLLANALEAIGSEGRIGLRTLLVGGRDAPASWSMAGARRLVVIEVSDSGPGLNAEDRERVWEPFQTTKAGRRAGLGLPVVRGFIEQSGGRIELDSAPGAGTTMRLIVPAAPRPAAPRPAAGRGDPRRRQESKGPRGAT